MADGRHIENHFLAITRLHIVRLRRNSEFGGIIACAQRFADENVKFRKSNMATAAILKIIISPYISRNLSEFHETYYADDSFIPGEVKKIINSQIQDGGRMPY